MLKNLKKRIILISLNLNLNLISVMNVMKVSILIIPITFIEFIMHFSLNLIKKKSLKRKWVNIIMTLLNLEMKIQQKIKFMPSIMIGNIFHPKSNSLTQINSILIKLLIEELKDLQKMKTKKKEILREINLTKKLLSLWNI